MSAMTAQAAPRIPEITLGWRLQMALGDRKVQDMADILGVNRATIGRWMHDRGAAPKRGYLLQWALITGVDAEWLLTGKAPRPGDPDEGPEVHRLGLEPRTRWLSAYAGGSGVDHARSAA